MNSQSPKLCGSMNDFRLQGIDSFVEFIGFKTS